MEWSLSEEFSRIAGILDKNKDKLFVQRILAPGNYPKLDNKDGSQSTHSMVWGESDGKFFVYPTVLMGNSGKLQRLSDDDAWSNAMETGGYIEMPTADEADWFSREYKQVWE